MDSKFSFGPEGQSKIVYIKAVEHSDLPEDVREQVDGVQRFYAVCTEEGEQLAIVKDRNVAFSLARQNDLAPMAVH